MALSVEAGRDAVQMVRAKVGDATRLLADRTDQSQEMHDFYIAASRGIAQPISSVIRF